MSNHVQTVKEMYAAFGRGAVAAIQAHMAESVSWEFEAPAQLAWSGIRKGPQEAAGFFAGIASQQSDMVLNMTEFLANDNAVAAFGRYQATTKASGLRVDTPVAHYFEFDNNGKVVRYQNFANSGAFVEALQPATAAAR